jgi:peroxiredoxin
MKTATKLVVGALAVMAAVAVLASCSKSNVAKANQAFNVNGGFASTSADFQAKLGVPAPPFTAVDVMTGQSVSLDQFKGKTVLLNFVNYGCSTSINQNVSAQLLAIRNLTGQRSDFIPVSVFCGCCPVDTLRQFAQSNDLKWPWLLDADNSIITKYADYVGQYGYPTLVFVDKAGTISDASGLLNVTDLGARLDRMASGSSAAGGVQ